MTALRMALSGEARCITLRGAIAGNTPTSIAGMIAKYLATSLAMLKVVRAPRVISSCLPISTMSRSFVGFESRSTMLPASLAAWVPVFMATPTSAWASAGASLVPSPVMATRCPAACSSRMRASFISGVAWARKSSTPASAAMAAAVSGLSPVIITVRMPMARSWAKRSLMPPLTTSLRKMTPSTSRPSATTRGVPPFREICVHRAGDGLGIRRRPGTRPRPGRSPPRPCGSSGRAGRRRRPGPRRSCGSGR